MSGIQGKFGKTCHNLTFRVMWRNVSFKCVGAGFTTIFLVAPRCD